MVAMAVVTILLVRSEKDCAAWTTWVLAVVIAAAATIRASGSKIDGGSQWRRGNGESSGKAI
jgi:hypothetical protein